MICPCAYAGADRPRVILGRHDNQCADRHDTDTNGCRGCEPCTEPHCRICGHAHADGTCAECLADVRANLHDIGRMCNALPAEVEHRGVNSEAAMLLGPTADPEMWQHVESSYLAGRLPEGWFEATHGKDCPREAKEPCTGCAGNDELHPLVVLGTWQMVWLDALEHHDDSRITIGGAIDYLDRQLTYMAGYDHVPFEDFARDLRRCVGYLERVLHDGDQIDTGAPCPACGEARLRKEYGRRVEDDRWTCPRCRQWWTEHDYRAKVSGTYIAVAEHLTIRDLADRICVPQKTLRTWTAPTRVRRNGELHDAPPKLRPTGRDHSGRKLYPVTVAEKLRDSA